MIVTAVPKKDNYNTTFSLEYRTDGIKDESAEIFDKIEEHNEKVQEALDVKGSGMSVGAIIGTIVGSTAGVIIIIVGALYIRKKRNEDKVTILSQAAQPYE